MGVKFGTEEAPPCQISPPSVQRQGCRTPKLKFLLRFDRNLEYKRPAGAYPLRDFHKICRVWTPFQDALGVKIWLDLPKGLWSYGGFKLRGRVSPKFSAPPSGKTILNSTQRASMDAGVKTPHCPHLSSHYCISILQSTYFAYWSVADSGQVSRKIIHNILVHPKLI